LARAPEKAARTFGKVNIQPAFKHADLNTCLILSCQFKSIYQSSDIPRRGGDLSESNFEVTWKDRAIPDIRMLIEYFLIYHLMANFDKRIDWQGKDTSPRRRTCWCWRRI
jgi:hypothetical protein